MSYSGSVPGAGFLGSLYGGAGIHPVLVKDIEGALAFLVALFGYLQVLFAPLEFQLRCDLH